ncbi:MAG: hypothetical protein EOP05_00455 [Proteobacteria bacterium]|nr:MAG: hypothetical protein EOP05_00455 [Pseudomonadota bacterium]
MIQLGDNNLADPAGAGKQAADVAKALKARNQKCVWITPASIRGAKCTKQRSQKGAVAVELKTALSGSGCEVIDSFTLTNSNPPMTKDPYCLHYPGKYDEWASAIKPKLLDAINKASSASQKTPSRPVQQRSSR